MFAQRQAFDERKGDHERDAPMLDAPFQRDLHSYAMFQLGLDACALRPMGMVQTNPLHPDIVESFSLRSLR